MTQFNDYSQFVAVAYVISGLILLGFAMFSWWQLHKTSVVKITNKI